MTFLFTDIEGSTRRWENGLRYAQTAQEMETDPRYDPLPSSWSRHWEAAAHLYAGRVNQAMGTWSSQIAQDGSAHVWGLCGQAMTLPLLRTVPEAPAIADEALAAARAHANPFYIAWALFSCALAYARPDPDRALDTAHEALDFARDHRLVFWEANIAREAARLEVAHGDLETGLTFFDRAIDSQHHGGNLANLATTLADLAIAFARIQRPDIAATLFGTVTRFNAAISGFRTEPLRTALGDAVFKQCAAIGAAMEPAEAARYARDQIRLARRDLGDAP